MKLGTQTGSIVNHMMANNGGIDAVQIGMAATLLSWSDRHPGTVLSVDAVKKIVAVQFDNYRRIDNNGISESQEYEYSPNPQGAIVTFKWTTKGWKQVFFNTATGRWNQCSGGYGLFLGEREHYHDFSF